MSPRDAMTARGHVVVPVDVDALLRLDPFAMVEAVLGVSPELAERQPIHPVPGGRSFASSSAETPLHSDSQLWEGSPPHLQLMVCERPAREGGASLLLDTWPLLDRIRAEDAGLFQALCTVPRLQRFVFGDVEGTTLSLRGGGHPFTASPVPDARDPVGARLAPWLSAAPCIEVRVRRGEALLVDNHRMLHGRRAFSDPERRFTRVLAWLREPLAVRGDLLEALSVPATRCPWPRAAEWEELPRVRRRAVLAMLRGVPPGVLARSLAVHEAELYAWRERALAGAGAALREP